MIGSDYMNNLDCSILAQERDYDRAYIELKNGKKLTHWMQYIFPQIKGLGYGANSMFYGIESLEEAILYLNHPLLGERLITLCNILLELNIYDPVLVFGYVDSLKLISSMTLFPIISNNDIFNMVLDKYFNGDYNQKTIDICNKLNNKQLKLFYKD